MKGKQFRLIIKMALVAIFIDAMLLSHFFVVDIVFAQNEKQQEKVIDIDKLDHKINTIEKKINAIEQKISRHESEVCAAEKLVEISEKNLIAPKYVTGILIGLIIVFSALFSIAIFIIRNGILKEIKDTSNKYREEIDGLITTTESLKVEEYRLLAYSYNTASLQEWGKKNYDRAIEFSQEAIKNAEKAWSWEPEDFDKKTLLYRYRSNLAYYYVEKGRTDKKGEAIKYAKMGLEVGQDIEDLDLIDNYLYIIMKFSELLKDKGEWLKVFEIYKDRIFEIGIRNPEEQKEYNTYYDKLKKEPF